MTGPTLPEVAFDEAGNTGADLLNQEQPVFALASVSFTTSEADELLSPLRTRQTGELKFSRLRKTDSGRRRLLEFLGSPKLRTDTVALSLYNKRFVAVAKMVDLLIEPLAHADGHDLLKDGFNLSTANLLHICMPVFFGNGSEYARQSRSAISMESQETMM